MKDYTFNSEDKKNFILNYVVSSNVVGEKNIIVKLASGEKMVVPYSKDNEKKILMKMREQVLNSKSYLDEMDYNKYISFGLPFADIFLAFGMYGIFGESYILSIPGILFLKNLAIGMNSRSKIKDIEKLKLFLENEELFKKDNMNSNVLSNISKKARDTIDSKDDITLNDMDKFKYNDVRTMIDRSNRDKKLGLDYDTKRLVKGK